MSTKRRQGGDQCPVGRRGHLGADGRLTLEVIGAGRRPLVRPCQGLCLRLSRPLAVGLELGDALSPCSSSLSRAGNGSVSYDLTPGVWCIDGVIVAGRERQRWLLSIEGGERRCRAEPGLGSRLLASAWPQAHESISARIEAINTEALRALANIQSERGGYGQEHVGDFTVFPVFDALPSATEIAFRIARRQITEIGDFVRRLCAPKSYRIDVPVSATGKTPQAAAAAAQAVLDQREREREEAEQFAEAAGLPALKGSPRQVAWALSIRARAQKKNPSLKALRQASTARYWIDRRDEF